ncbi:hypothetical protein WJ0W_006336 [Paenibacillus melissococcoides]|uniref:Uncharacterized protein n=2 Tax=Paenibacillus melissococcoides TaxID=2912268 RepID=A0ABM9GAU7_9BACL|nr:hypothetical protein [Paenibacillus dendritiformis]MEB9895889.1 hypothetical protein [Bacillus cereus]CAH8249150.1 hypothetical protein WJ0W_006336 [Paenibacillus melissococcoides]
MRKIIVVVVAALLLAGCRSLAGSSRPDPCIFRVHDGGVICYGMEAAEVEWVAGKGELASNGEFLMYDHGWAVYYRNKVASLIYIAEGDYYAHPSGAKIGDLPDKLRKKYGTATIDDKEIIGGSLVYVYDRIHNKPLELDDHKNLPIEEPPAIFPAVGAYLDDNGYIDILAVGDLRAYLTGK